MSESMLETFMDQDIELVEEVRKLFDAESENEASDKNQRKLSCLAAVLCFIEEHYPNDGSTLSNPFLRNLQALQAAYHLGQSSPDIR